MHYIIFYYVIMYYAFSEAATTVLESFTNSIRKHLCWSLFFSLRWFFLERHLFCMNKPYFCQKFSSHRLTSQTSYLLLFYGEHFCEFSESDLGKLLKKTFHFTTNISIYTGHIHFEVLFCTNCEGLFCL